MLWSCGVANLRVNVMQLLVTPSCCSIGELYVRHYTAMLLLCDMFGYKSGPVATPKLAWSDARHHAGNVIHRTIPGKEHVGP